MKTAHFGLVPVVQKTGPQWHLQGDVQRDPYRRRTITLTRPVDALSPEISAMAGRVIPDVRVTKVKGKGKLEFLTVTMKEVVITSITRGQSGPSRGAGSNALETGELETLSLQFQSFEVESTTPSGSAADDWAT